MDVKIIRTNHKRRGHVSGFIFEVRKHTLILLMFLLLFAGLLCGNFAVSGSESIFDSIGELFSSHITSLNRQTFLKSFFYNAVVNVGLVLLNFIFGLCAIGFPVSLVSVFGKGLSIGALSSYMYSSFSLKGFGYCMLVVYPVQIIACLLLLKTGQESFSMSLSLLRILTERQQSNMLQTDIHKYLIRFIAIIIINLIVSVFSALMNIYVTKFFNF